ncbi:unnamed protein product [Pleuronectes platessa]|uniref:Uncharacterized protein n=1 Tax=Pleuronectes platessa TaxID=8262 RepID=A0A9N7V8V8_PLEPL|nr:unnamed protein product [Pleuronectes platessa]
MASVICVGPVIALWAKGIWRETFALITNKATEFFTKVGRICYWKTGMKRLLCLLGDTCDLTLWNNGVKFPLCVCSAL